MTIFAVPGPVKAVFDFFPLEIYPPISKADDAMAYEIAERTFGFQGANSFQEDVNNTFTLAVYNTFHESNVNVILASDPWCLYAQLSLCKRNSLKLPETTRSKGGKSNKPQHRMALLSPMATQHETLPILIEGHSKRFIRSSESIHETLRIRVAEDPQQLMYISLLDHIIYDCWITQVLFSIPDEEFLKLYSFESGGQNRLANRLLVTNLKLALVKRNEFHLRHKILAKNVESNITYKASSLPELLDPIFEKCKKALKQFQTLLATKFTSATPTYLELKIASYVLCVLNLSPAAPLRIFLEQNCHYLLNHSERVLKSFANKL